MVLCEFVKWCCEKVECKNFVFNFVLKEYNLVEIVKCKLVSFNVFCCVLGVELMEVNCLGVEILKCIELGKVVVLEE